MESLRFGPYRLDPAEERIWRGQEIVKLTPKTFSVLRYLAERPQRVVTKEELFNALWPETAVSDAALTRCIHELREALTDDARSPHYVETVHRRGFRFVGPPPDVGRRIKRTETMYAKSGDVHIAYQMVGDGPVDLVVVPGGPRTWKPDGSSRSQQRFTSASRRSAGSSSSTSEARVCPTRCLSTSCPRWSNAWTTCVR